ncbi:MAG: hypothetical protein AB7O71_12185 [Hyphomicrobiaceae bacterium]
MREVLAAILFIWAGLLFGVSFVATPAKFMAQSLPIAQALDIGRWTFHVLAWIEWGFVAIVAALLGLAWRSPHAHIGLVISLVAVVIIVLATETFALRPLLDARVIRIIAGESVSPSLWHNGYIALEGLKFLLVLAAGICTMRWPGPNISSTSLDKY